MTTPQRCKRLPGLEIRLQRWGSPALGPTRTLALFALVGLFAVAADAQQPAAATVPAERRLKVATWNLLNLFDNSDHPTKPDEGTSPKSIAALKAMSHVIDALDVDVLGVEEVENRECLERLNRHLRRPFLFVELIEGNDFRGIDVGLLSRVPIERVASHRLMELPGEHRFARDFPLFRLRVAPERVIEIGVVHLKSKRGKASTSNAWRRAEATGIRRILERQRKAEPDVPVVVMGDFNDTRAAATLEPVMTYLKDATAGIAEAERYTYKYRNQGQQIDFVVASDDLPVVAAEIEHLADNPSDHFPVVITFDAGAAIVRAETPAGEEWSEPERPRMRADDLEAAERYALREVEIEGKVVKVYRPKSGRSASLNFHDSYKRAVVVYIPADAFPRLPKLDPLVGRHIRVRGPVYKRGDYFQIALTHREQLSLK